jgi:tetratricopeptide (TPR) repeat protein
MSEIESSRQEREIAPQSRRGPIWLLLLPFALAILLRLAALPASLNPQFFPPDAHGTRTLSAILFGLLVLTVAWMARAVAGAVAGLSAGIVLAVCWPALLLSGMQTGNVALTLVLAVGLALVCFGGRLSGLGWTLWTLIALLLALPLLRNTQVGALVLLPVHPSDAMLLVWRGQIPLLARGIALGVIPLFALGLSSFLVLRGRSEARSIAVFLLVLVFVDWFWPLGSNLDLAVLSLLAVLSGVCIAAISASVRTGQRKALLALSASILLILALGSYFTQVSDDDLLEAEITLRLEHAEHLFDKQEDQSAREQLKWILDRDPQNEDARTLQARILLTHRQFKAAADIFKDILRDFPESVNAQVGIGWSNVYLGNFITAKMSFSRALNLDPDDARAMIGMGLAEFSANNDLDGGEKLIRQGLKIDPNVAEGYAGLAMILIKRGVDTPEKVEQLHEWVGRAIELDPRNDIARRYARREGWYDLLPESERPVNYKQLMKKHQSQQ